MKEFSIPFNTYDFFGYLLPGTLFSLGVLVVFNDKIKSWVDGYNSLGISIPFTVVLTMLMAAGLYFIGQIIGCIGHIIYDRMVVRNILGYPFYRILGLNQNVELSSMLISYVLIMCGFIGILIPVFVRLVHFFFNVNEVVFFSYFAVILIFLIIFILLFAFSAKIVQDGSSIKKCDLKGVRKFFERITEMFLKVTATNVGVNEAVQNKFMMKLKKRTGLRKNHFCKEYGSDIYWVTYIDLMKAKDPCHQGKISNWLDMYGCLRNYSCAFLLLATIESIRIYASLFCECSEGFVFEDYAVLVGFLFLSFLLFVRYWIMYYSYYSKYIIRAYALEDFSSNVDN